MRVLAARAVAVTGAAMEVAVRAVAVLVAPPCQTIRLIIREPIRD